MELWSGMYPQRCDKLLTVQVVKQLAGPCVRFATECGNVEEGIQSKAYIRAPVVHMRLSLMTYLTSGTSVRRWQQVRGCAQEEPQRNRPR